MDNALLIAQYEDALLGKGRLTISASSQDPHLAALEKENAACVILKYAITQLLGWSPEDAIECLTPNVVSSMKLDILVNKYIEAPPDIQKGEEYDWYVYRAFRGQCEYNPYTNLIRMYKKVITGEVKKFPKNYFDGLYGERKASVLLMYVLGRNVAFSDNDSEKLYKMFADTPAIHKRMKEWKIFDVCRIHYASPLEWLHLALPEEMANDLLYNYYSFKQIYDQVA